MTADEREALPRILAFLGEIGLEVREGPLPGSTFLPGIAVEQGTLRFDPARLLHPGDLLHEAGHLAVLPAAERATRPGDVDGDAGWEMAAIAWSYAAARVLALRAEVLFHPEGYKGSSAALIDAFEHGRYFGVPLLEWIELTDHQHPGAQTSPTRYPAMKRWLRP